jgi:hypothetical protein
LGARAADAREGHSKLKATTPTYDKEASLQESSIPVSANLFNSRKLFSKRGLQ